MTTTLSDLLLERLQRETKKGDEWPELVLAALEGDAAVDALLDAGTPKACAGTGEGQDAQLRAAGLPALHHGRRLPRDRPAGHARPRPGPRPHARHRPQRLGQVQLRRGPRAAPHGRDLPLGPAHQGVAGRLAEPPSRHRRRPGGAGARRRAGAVRRGHANGPTARASRMPRPGRRSKARRGPGWTRWAGRTRSRRTARSFRTTSWARCSTRARRSSTTRCRRSSGSTPWWTRRPSCRRPAHRARRR